MKFAVLRTRRSGAPKAIRVLGLGAEANGRRCAVDPWDARHELKRAFKHQLDQDLNKVK